MKFTAQMLAVWQLTAWFGHLFGTLEGTEARFECDEADKIGNFKLEVVRLIGQRHGRQAGPYCFCPRATTSLPSRHEISSWKQSRLSVTPHCT